MGFGWFCWYELFVCVLVDLIVLVLCFCGWLLGWCVLRLLFWLGLICVVCLLLAFVGFVCSLRVS